MDVAHPLIKRHNQAAQIAVELPRNTISTSAMNTGDTRPPHKPWKSVADFQIFTGRRLQPRW